MSSDTTNTHDIATVNDTTESATLISASPAVGAATQAEASADLGATADREGQLAGLADLFGFPAPVHWPRPRGCQWCEPAEAQTSSLREENPLVWVLHVLAEHVPQEVLTRVHVYLNHDRGKVEVDAHGRTFDQVDRIAEALDLFAQDVRTLPSGTAVAVFGSDHDAVTLYWYTELENVNPALTPEPTSYRTGHTAPVDQLEQSGQQQSG